MILKQLLKSKLHHAHVTQANSNYIGSITIDAVLMAQAGIDEGELVHVWAVDHKSRIQTYAISGEAGVIGINGGGAHYFEKGDRIIIAAFAITDEKINPVVFLLNEHNQIIKNMSRKDNNDSNILLSLRDASVLNALTQAFNLSKSERRTILKFGSENARAIGNFILEPDRYPLPKELSPAYTALKRVILDEEVKKHMPNIPMENY